MKSLNASLALSALPLLLLATCYNPEIESGALQCSSTFKCPEGFFCANQRCWKEGTSPPTGGSGGMAGTGGMLVAGRGGVGGLGGIGGGTGGAGGTCAPPFGPFERCASQRPAGAVCDPVCQAGCPCGQRCTFEGSNAVCRPLSPPYLNPNDRCNPMMDQCRPGLICLEEVNPAACAAHCYRYCRTDAECMGGARCSVDIMFGSSTTSAYKVCSPPPESCLPWGRAACMQVGRPLPAFGCYILSARFPDIAVCDCAGNKRLNERCEFEHECEPGLECVKIGAEAICRRVCAVGAAGLAQGGCPVGERCVTFTGGTRFGYCTR